MARWGEFSESMDPISHGILLNSLPRITSPSEFELNTQEHFQSNPNFQTSHQNTYFDSTKDQKKQNIKSSPFFETIKLIVAKEMLQENQEESNDTINISNSGKDKIAQLMRQSVIMILTHTGFDYAQNLAIELLVDVLEYYMKSFGKLLRNYTDSMDLQSPNDFCDIVDKVLHHMNIPNIEVLRKYNDDLIEYYHRIENEHHKSDETNFSQHGFTMD